MKTEILWLNAEWMPRYHDGKFNMPLLALNYGCNATGGHLVYFGMN